MQGIRLRIIGTILLLAGLTITAIVLMTPKKYAGQTIDEWIVQPCSAGDNGAQANAHDALVAIGEAAVPIVPYPPRPSRADWSSACGL